MPSRTPPPSSSLFGLHGPSSPDSGFDPVRGSVTRALGPTGGTSAASAPLPNGGEASGALPAGAGDGPFLGIYGIGSSPPPTAGVLEHGRGLAPDDRAGHLPGSDPVEFDPSTGEVLRPSKGKLKGKRTGEGWSYPAALVERYALQKQASRIMLDQWRKDGRQGKAHGVTRCLHWLHPRQGERPHADVYRHNSTRRTFFGGTEVCGSPWACPVCSAKIAERRAEEIRAAVDAWISEGGICLFVTLTVPHRATDALGPMVVDFRRALELFRGGKGGAAINRDSGRIGVIRALELTWGQLNGWHPHSHEIWFCHPPAEGLPVSRIVRRWQDSAQAAGFDRPSDAHGCRIDVVQSTEQAAAALAEYLAKMGRDLPEDGRPLWGVADELARAHSKRGRLLRRMTPFDFLRAQFDPEASAAERAVYRRLFAEYVEAFRRVAQVFWSRGLKARFEIVDRTDEETAQESRETADELARIEVEQWERVVFARVDHRANVLLVAQEGGADLLREFLDSLPPPGSS